MQDRNLPYTFLRGQPLNVANQWYKNNAGNFNNPVVNTKLPAILSHLRSTTVSLETYPFIHLYKNNGMIVNEKKH